MKTFARLLAYLLLLATAGCGGGGGSDEPGGNNPPPSGSIVRTGFAIGPIANFGSVIVNGVRYSTTGATITVDDAPGLESDLRVGQVVRIRGQFDASLTTGTASQISFDDNVEGPVQAIDPPRARWSCSASPCASGPTRRSTTAFSPHRSPDSPSATWSKSAGSRQSPPFHPDGTRCDGPSP